MAKAKKPTYEYSGTPYSLVTIKELLPLAKRLAKRLCDEVRVDPVLLEPIVFDQTFFADGELMSRKPREAYLRDTRVIYLDCPRFPTISDGIMNTVLTLDAIAATGVRGITHMLLYAPYARQDKRKPGEPLSWKKVAEMFKHAAEPLDRLVAVELHTEQHELALGGLKLDHVKGHKVFAEHFATSGTFLAEECIVVSPDATGAERAEKFQEKLFPNAVTSEAGYFRKRRPKDNHAETLSYTGPDPREKIVFIYDDMIDTGGTLCGAAKVLQERGAKEVIAVAMHALLNGNAVQKISAHGIKVVGSESIPRSDEWLEANKLWFTQVKLDEILAKVILAQRAGDSASSLLL